MNALDEEGMIREGSIVNLLENKIVLIVPASSHSEPRPPLRTSGKAGSIALGDPASVPAGTHAEKALTSLGSGIPSRTR